MATCFFIKKGDLDDTFAIAEMLLSDKEDLVHKGVGWMLRFAGDKDKPRLLAFLATYAVTMPRTMLRYAIEKFTKEQRDYYLALKKLNRQMISSKEFKELALSFPEAEEHKHFENIAFKVSKKIFVTLNEKKNQACVKLSLVDQDVFALTAKSVIYPVPNKWGKQGWTIIELDKIKADLLNDAITTAFCTVAPKRLTSTFISKLNNIV